MRTSCSDIVSPLTMYPQRMKTILLCPKGLRQKRSLKIATTISLCQKGLHLRDLAQHQVCDFKSYIWPLSITP